MMNSKDGLKSQNGLEEFASWADLCEPPAPVELTLLNGRKVKYLPWIPADEMAEIQRKARASGQRQGQPGMDWKLFQGLILEQVMLHPRIRTDDDRRMAAKMDSRVSMQIVGDVTNAGTLRDMQTALGES